MQSFRAPLLLLEKVHSPCFIAGHAKLITSGTETAHHIDECSHRGFSTLFARIPATLRKRTLQEVAGNLLLLIEEVMALLHPMMPFVTQEIYSHLPQVADGSVAADLLKRSFPESGRYPREQGAEASMAAFIDVVGGLRSTRDELGVARNEAGRVYLLQEEEGRAEALHSQADSFRQLSGCVLESVVFSLGDVPTERKDH